jgi:hypothetical protein
MRTMLMAFLMGLAASATAPAMAVDTLIAPAFSGTIVSTYPDGRTSRLWLNRDGTFLADGRAHERQAGRWRIKGHAVCMSQLKPVPIPFLSYCAPIPTTGVDVAWTGKAVTGEPVVIRLIPQR